MSISLPIRPPVIVHHMAALDGQYPPNSLEAIRACLEADAPFIEIDITALADTDYLLVHDPVLESETTGVDLVAYCTAEQARGLFYKQHGRATLFKVPLLREVVALFLDYPNGARLQCDFKNIIPFPTDEPYQRLIELLKPLGDRVIVSSGADWQLRRLRAIAPALDIGFDIGNNLDYRPPNAPQDPRYPPWRAGAYGYHDDHPIASIRAWPTAEYLADRCDLLSRVVERVSTFYISHHFLIKSLEDGFDWTAALHERGIRVDAWTLDSTNPVAVNNARRLLALGVDQFTTNTPAQLARLLNDTMEGTP